MASSIERMTENDTNNVASNINAKSLVEDAAEKKKNALGDIKNKIDPNSIQPHSKNDKNYGKIENLIDQSTSSGVYKNIEVDDDPIKGEPVDYEKVWSDEWILPLYENLDEWIDTIRKAKEEPEQTEVVPPINDDNEMVPSEPEFGIEYIESPEISDLDEKDSDESI